MANSDPNVPVAGDSVRQVQHDSVMSYVREIEGVLGREFSDEAFAHRHHAAALAIDVLKAALDALFSDSGIPAARLELLGAKAAAETNGEVVHDVNVAPLLGDRARALPGLPDPDEKPAAERPSTGPNPADASGNMTTDPEVNPRLKGDVPSV